MTTETCFLMADENENLKACHWQIFSDLQSDKRQDLGCTIRVRACKKKAGILTNVIRLI
jgi:hypothetical protein